MVRWMCVFALDTESVVCRRARVGSGTRKTTGLGLAACCGIVIAAGMPLGVNAQPVFARTADIFDLGDEGATAVFAYDVNEAGEATGTLRAGPIAAAFRWTPAAGIEVLDRASVFAPAAGHAIAGDGTVVGFAMPGEDALIPTLGRWGAGSGALEDLGFPAGLAGAVGRGIDDVAGTLPGTIVGTVFGPDGFLRQLGFGLDADGFFALAPAPSGAVSISGDFIGGFANPDRETVAGRVWRSGSDGTITSIEPPFSGPSQVTAVNAAGDAGGVVVGSAAGFTPGGLLGPRGFVAASDDASVTVIDAAAPAERSAVFGLNTWGDAVGMIERDGERIAVLFNPAIGLVELDELLSPADRATWRLRQARAVNDARQVVGWGEKLVEPGGTETEVRAFLLTVPPIAACPADRTGDGVLNSDDIVAMLRSLEAGNVVADVDGSGVGDAFDLLAYLAAFGCP